jgi:hypothetical protein
MDLQTMSLINLFSLLPSIGHSFIATQNRLTYCFLYQLIKILNSVGQATILVLFLPYNSVYYVGYYVNISIIVLD